VQQECTTFWKEMRKRYENQGRKKLRKKERKKERK
jgi:hypothetical protein